MTRFALAVKKYLGYLWTTIINLVSVGVLIAIYGSLSDHFQIIVVSILALIYINVIWPRVQFKMSLGLLALGLFTEIRRIKPKASPFRPEQIEQMEQISTAEDVISSLSRPPSIDFDADLLEITRQIKELRVGVIINSCFYCIMVTIVLWNLFLALAL
jgi:hypothetical protein